MQFSFKQVEGLLKVLQPFLLKAGINRCTMPTGDINQIPAGKFMTVFDWLSEILTSEEWEEVQNVWKLCTPEVWAGYDMFEITDLAEQILLQKAVAKLKLRWMQDRPTGFFGKHYEPETYADTLTNQEDSGETGI